MKILIVEDLFAAFLAAKAIVGQYGLTVDHAKDGSEAVEMATQNEYLFILMDIGLPLLNGIDATRKIRCKKITTPIYALSANLGEFSKQMREDAGMNLGFEKPLMPEYLAEIFLHSHTLPPTGAAKLLEKLPGLDKLGAASQWTGVDEATLTKNRQTLNTTLSLAKNESLKAIQMSDYKKISSLTKEIAEVSLNAGSLRLCLATNWLANVLKDSSATEPTKTEHTQILISAIDACAS